MPEKRLSLKTKLGFGVCDLGGNLYFTVLAFLLLNYLTDTVGISAGLAGTIIMIGKIWDAVTDPVAGYMSDHTRSRRGRRRPYILFGSVPLFLTMVIMFTNPQLQSQGLLFAWGIVCFSMLSTAYTAVNIPYSSLTPELTRDFHERSVLNGYRFGFAVIGTLLGAGAALPLVNAFSDKNTGYTVMGAMFGFVMMVTALATYVSIREPQTAVVPRTGFFKTYFNVFRNTPYVFILLTYALHVTALTVVSGIAIYYFKYVHLNERVTTAAMLILLVTAMVFIPVSVLVSKKIGKKAVYGIGMFVFSAGTMVLFFFGHLYDVSFSLITMFFTGIGMGFTYAMPYAMVPDAIEYDYLKSGERSEGAFYGIWTFGIKIGQAVALGISGGVLSLSGYIPDVTQTPQALLGIRFLLGPIPAVIFFLALITLYCYPINEAHYNEILDEIRKMESRSN